MTDMTDKPLLNETGTVVIGLAAVNIMLPLAMGYALTVLPFGVSGNGLFWLCVVALLGLNLALFRRFPESGPLVLFLVAFNGLTTYMLGALAFLPNLHLWVDYVLGKGF